METANVICICRDALQMQTPVEVVFKNFKRKAVADCVSLYRKEKLIRFRIRMNTDALVIAKEKTAGVIIHEMIHAKMIEAGAFNEDKHHDETFSEIANVLHKFFKYQGLELDITDIWNPEVDND